MGLLAGRTLPFRWRYAKIQKEGYCSMYGLCGKRSDGKLLNCPLAVPSVKPDELLSSKIQSLCPEITGNICCTADQFDTLRTQVQQAIPFLVGCPACLRNFLNLFCELSCSPNQSLFINVTSVVKVNNTSTVDAIDFYISPAFSKELYDSCKDVKFGTMNTRAMEFIGGGAESYKEWLAFIGRQADLGEPGSPYAINFPSTVPDSSTIKPMDVPVYSCGDSLLGCSCGDCPSSPMCSDQTPPTPHHKRKCSIKFDQLLRFFIGHTVRCPCFCIPGWGFSLRKRERAVTSPRSKPLLTDKSPDEVHSADEKEYSSGPMRYGTWVARNPTVVLCSSLAIPLLLCLGLIRFRVETRPEKLWVGPGSKAAMEKEYFDSHLAPFYRIEQLILTTIPKSEHSKQPGIVTEENIQLLFKIQKKVDGLRANYSGSTVSLTDICLKPLGEECATQSVLQYFKMDPENYDDYGGVEHAEYCFQHFSSAATCLSAFQAPIDPSTATAFVITYPVNNVLDQTGQENGKAEEIMPMVKSQNLSLSFSSESSIQEELKRESTADVLTIMISYLVMFAYISVALGGIPRPSSFFISSKVLLSLSGVLVVIVSVLGSVGFYSAIGIKSTLIIMEVGVDNMCILVHAVRRQPLDLSLEGRISNALVEVGPSITLASLAEVLAFAVGSFIPMPACRVFSMFAALAVLLDFLLQITAFVSLIIFDCLRAEDSRIDCFPCIKVPTSDGDHNKDRGVRDLGLLGRYMKEIHAPILGFLGVKIAVVAVFIGFAFASIALSTRIQPGLEQQIALPRDSYLQDYFNDLAKYLRVGPPLYFVVKDYNYSLESNHTNLLCSISQCDSGSLLNEISQASLAPESSYIAKPAASWLDDFLVWLSPEAFGCCRKFTNGSYCPPDDQPPCCSPDEGSCDIGGVCKDCTTCFLHSDLQKSRPSTVQFREKLPWFLNALPSADCAKGGHGAYTTSVDLNGYETGIIQASAFRTYHTPLNKQVDYVDSMRAALDFSSKVSNSLKIEIFPYSVFYIYFEQYLDIWKTALIDISVGLGAVFIACWVITCSLWNSAIILIVLAMIVVDLMGVMAILNIQLNAVSIVNLVMSIGIAVEFCVHIAHAFSISRGNRGQRAKEALSTMGASWDHAHKAGGVIVLCFSRSEIFVVYYFQMYLALVLIGFLHGLVFLPVLLSICGPPSRYVLVESSPSSEEPETSTELN
ncbi:unnamed protein product [Spirodela intermedia]|uniref:SSD domain-containing protein n=1 Tax=Spirodela intermedia TaxID=51605 RepID=A0A7I8IDM6_SPIIN|nr:unnamed protein product [Spirodela intermedia]CAA6655866.1 unnamed protein product [Spirodela intermedia]